MPRVTPYKKRFPFVIHGNYVGPGNPIDEVYRDVFSPVDAIDEAAMYHDMDPAFRYFSHTPADDRFMARLDAITPQTTRQRFVRSAALSYHRVKRALFPHDDTDNLIKNNLAMDQPYNPYAYSKSSYRIGGRVRPSRRLGPPSKYAMYGSHGCDELNGQLNNGSPDTAYMCVTSFKVATLKNGSTSPDTKTAATATRISESGCVVYHVAAALLRDILAREFRIELGTHDDPVMPYRVNSDNNATSNANVIAQAPRMDPCSKLVFISRYAPFGAVPTFSHVYTLTFTYDEMIRGTTVSEIPTSVLKSFRECVSELANNVLGSTLCGAHLNQDSYGTRELYGYMVGTPDASDNAILSVNALGNIVLDAAAAASDLDNITSRSTTNSTSFVSGWSPIRRLDSSYVKAYSTANLRIQNVSLNDDGDSSIDKNNTNTLVGLLLKFKDPYPTVKSPGTYMDFHGRFGSYLNAGTASFYYPTTANGVNDVASATYVDQGQTYNASGAYNLFQMAHHNIQKLSFDTDGDGLTIPSSALTGDWVQLPSPNLFMRCSGMNKFLLKPGEMRNVKLEFKFDGKISDFSKGLCLYSSTGNRVVAPPALGTSVMLGFEKYMQYSTSTIAVNYQLKYHAGAVMKRKKKVELQLFARDSLTTKKLAVADATTLIAVVPEPPVTI